MSWEKQRLPSSKAHLATTEAAEKARDRGKLRSRGLEKYHLALQILKGIRGLGGLLLSDEVVLVDITGVKELVGRLLVPGIGQKLRPADFPIRGDQCRAQPLKFITDWGSLSSSSSGASAAAQGQHEDEKTKRTEKVHGTTLL
jgi:hypothetical protein